MESCYITQGAWHSEDVEGWVGAQEGGLLLIPYGSSVLFYNRDTTTLKNKHPPIKKRSCEGGMVNENVWELILVCASGLVRLNDWGCG